MRGIIVGGMILGLLLGCNNGIVEDLVVEKRIGEIGRSVESTFYSFMGLIADTLGLTVTSKTTKQAVGQHFATLGTKLGEASAELDKVAERASADGDKDGLLGKANREAVDTAKGVLSKLKGHLDSLGTVGDSNVVGYAKNSSGWGTAADTEKLKKAYNALKGIVETAEKAGVSKPKVKNTALQIGSADNKNGAKILAVKSGNPGTDDAGKAGLILASVSGDEILASISQSTENKAIALSGNADVNTTPLEFAIGGSHTELSTNTTPKAEAVAGGIALRSLVAGGQLAAGASDDASGGGKEVQGVGVTAANKLLVAVEDMIKKTVNKVLEKAKGEIDKARETKATVQK